MAHHVLGTGAVRGLRLAQILVLARVFGPERLGEFQAFQLLCGLALALAPNPLATYFARAARVRDEETGTGLALGTALVVPQAAILIGVTAYAPTAARVHIGVTALLVGCLVLLADVARSLEGLWDRRQDFRTPRMIEACAVLGGLATALATRSHELALILAFGATYGIRAILLLALTPECRSLRFSREVAVQQIPFAIPLIMAGWSTYFYQRADDWAVAFLYGPSSLAIYSLAFYLPGTIGEIVALIDRPLVPAMRMATTRAMLQGLFAASGQLAAYLAALGGGTLFLLADPLLPVVLGPDWGPAIPYLRAFALLFALRAGTGQGWSALALTRGRTRYIMIVSWISACSAVVVGCPLIAWLGLWGGVVYSMLQLAVMGPLVRLPLVRQELGTLKPLVPGLTATTIGAVSVGAGWLFQQTLGGWKGSAAGYFLFILLLLGAALATTRRNPLLRRCA